MKEFMTINPRKGLGACTETKIWADVGFVLQLGISLGVTLYSL